jgi:hypothetical protein
MRRTAMPLETRDVDSISDPRFAAEMAHARQVWLQALKWRGDYGPHYTADEWLKRSTGAPAEES